MLSVILTFFLHISISVFASSNSLDSSNETQYVAKHGSLVPVTTVDIDPPVPDLDTKGRYRLHFKAFVNNSRFNYVDYSLDVVNTTRENCNDGYSSLNSSHSRERLTPNEESVPAKYINVSIEVDKIFSGCYSIEFTVGYIEEVIAEDQHLLWIQNGYTYDDFKEPDIFCTKDFNRTDVVVTFFPLKEQMMRYNKEVHFFNDIGEERELECSGLDSKYRCWGKGAMAGARDGNYTVQLSFIEPWAIPTGVYGSAAHTDCEIEFKAGEDKEPTPVATSPMRAQAVLVAAVCGGVVLLVLLAAAVLAYRRYFASHLDKNDKVYEYWQKKFRDRYNWHRSEEDRGSAMESRLVKSEAPPFSGEACKGAAEDEAADADEIVLVYARDAPPFMHAMALLRTALADLTGAKVWDIWEVETACAVAEAPVLWAQSKVAGAARLLLVESPAGTMLYHHNPIVGGPNFPTRVQYKQSHHSDYLLHYLLRAAADDLTHNQYSKYFVANIPSFQASEQFPHVSAHRRYALPGALSLLVSHLRVRGRGPPSPEPQLAPATPPADASCTPLNPSRTSEKSPRDAKLNTYKDQLVQAVLLLDDFVAKNPNYLFDEVMSIDTV